MISTVTLIITLNLFTSTIIQLLSPVSHMILVTHHLSLYRENPSTEASSRVYPSQVCPDAILLQETFLP